MRADELDALIRAMYEACQEINRRLRTVPLKRGADLVPGDWYADIIGWPVLVTRATRSRVLGVRPLKGEAELDALEMQMHPVRVVNEAYARLVYENAAAWHIYLITSGLEDFRRRCLRAYTGTIEATLPVLVQQALPGFVEVA